MPGQLGNAPFESASGTFTGNGTSQEIICGFRPSKIELFNVTDGDSYAHWHQGMANGTACAIAAAAAAVTTGGITPTARGFSVGSDVAVNENAKVFAWFATK
jgi:transcription elongation factor